MFLNHCFLHRRVALTEYACYFAFITCHDYDNLQYFSPLPVCCRHSWYHETRLLAHRSRYASESAYLLLFPFSSDPSGSEGGAYS